VSKSDSKSSLTNSTIGVAKPDDCAAWVQLRYQLWPHCPLERHALEVAQLVTGDGIVALARVGVEVVGMAEVSIRHDHVEGTTAAPVPYLEGWFVAEEYRNRGVGRQLLKFVDDWAVHNGYAELASDAELDNALSIELHGRLGFREVGRSVHFVKTLASPPP
jgi:aminoglycoside 6'-N-acetyltransferase I